MKSSWSDREAKDFVVRYGALGVNEDVALRVYTTRLLGSDPKLVLHGGGNTSVKTVVSDQLGEDVDVLCVKGSGWDMGNIEPAGLPAVRLAPLKRLRALDALSDEDMVNFQRINLLDASAPNPSVETLLHAFLPHKFIDHVHSTAVLSLIDQPDGVVPAVLEKAGKDPAAIAQALRQRLSHLPRVSGQGTQLSLSNEARDVLTGAHAIAERMQDDYVSTEHVLLAIAEQASGSDAARVLAEQGVDSATIMEALSSIRGSQRVTSVRT